MSADITQFLFQPAGSPVKHKVRTVTREGDPWFVLADVCSVLEHSNSRMVAERLDADEKGVSIVDTPGGPQEITVVNESGLWSLVLTSRKPIINSIETPAAPLLLHQQTVGTAE